MQYFGRSFIYNMLWSIQGFFIQDFPPVRSPGRRERSAACDAAPGFPATVLSRICGNIVLGGPDGPMMNFYEEFGVRNDASVEEIRQAYKTLARVLHPDSQMDEKLRAAAACQMKRLHEILDIFLDPRKRRAYDESLAAAAYPNAALHWAPPEAAEPSVRPLDKFEFAQSALRHWSWILMACMILGSGFWYVTARIPTLAESVPNGLPHEALPNGTGPVLRPVEQTAKHETGDSAAVETRLSSVAEAALPKELGAAKPESPGLPNVPVPIPGALSGPAPTSAYSARAPEVPEPEDAPSVPSIHGSSFAGEWFYVPAIEKPDPHLYPPVDIEFQLTEKDGILDGQYRGKYKVSDTAVSQDVLFQVQGKSPAGASAALVWTSSDGANGEIDLVLRQPNLMRVTWWTTKLGRRPGLSSGAATLFRQQTP